MNKTNPAAVNARSRKDVMYAEVERLRALLDAQGSTIAMHEETIERQAARLTNAERIFREQRSQIEELKARSEGRCRCLDCDGDRNEHDPWCEVMRSQIEERRCDCTVSHGDVVIHERDCQQAHDEEYIASINADAKEIARRAAILLKRSCRPNGDRIEQFKDGKWELVPQRVLRYATR